MSTYNPAYGCQTAIIRCQTRKRRLLVYFRFHEWYLYFSPPERKTGISCRTSPVFSPVFFRVPGLMRQRTIVPVGVNQL